MADRIPDFYFLSRKILRKPIKLIKCTWYFRMENALENYLFVTCNCYLWKMGRLEILGMQEILNISKKNEDVNRRIRCAARATRV
jgi:hypothetical protein